MKLLLVADEESKFLWDYYDENLFKDVDFIISAGDLKAKYLSFLTTMTHKRVLYVYGNHDTRYLKDPPLGCDSIDDKIIVQNGIRILGLGGSYRYKKGPYQFTEKKMRKRIKNLRTMIKQFGGVDIIVTHAPPKGHGDGEDLCHNGFEVFNEIIEEFKPSYFLHGHQHLNYAHKTPRVQYVDQTTLINGYKYHFIDYEPNDFVYEELTGIKKIINSFLFFRKHTNTLVMKEYRRYNRKKKLALKNNMHTKKQLD